ncbi:MAG: HAD family phosphatase [Verrucomicrobiales bacterium]|nr:HAD family phosphatase [Verrucomicrobiales bacterium]
MSYSLLFDIGNVIVSFDFRIAARKVAPMCDIPAESLLPSVSGMMIDLESGVISSDQFIDSAIDKIGYTGERDFLVHAFQDIFEVNELNVELIKQESGKGVPLYLLSNTSGIHVPWLFRHYPVFQYFEKGIFSHEVFCMKPDPEIYRKTIDILGVDPAKTIYIDDIEENCRAGAKAGFQTCCYRKENHTEFLAELAARKAALAAC